MMVTGLLYALVGIKNPWIHAFFSTAYMAALGITVLIVYVMNVPLSNALQGGYVAAIILSGCAVGAASMFFKELTEGLGCALGGFCVSMWLLCLVPGGLLQTTASKAIFLACFTLVGFAFYFSRFTRDWSLIVLIAFAGSTITVLGIDCFSRAGLKEFWAYIWALNDNLFPLGADTYPVTRGIRVETAAIIIIFLIATMSQVRLWRVVREKREKRAALRAEGQRNLQEEEEAVGRQIEEANTRDRAEWERVYGDGATESVTAASQLSDGREINEKNLANGNIYVTRDPAGDGTELEEMSECGHSAIDQLMAGEGEDGGVTVRVAADEPPEHTMAESCEDEEDAVSEKRTSVPEAPDQPEDTEQVMSKSKSKRASGATTANIRVPANPQVLTPSPEVVPLPFNVPRSHRPGSQRSSVAAFVDVDDGIPSTQPRHAQRSSVVQRLSQGSAELLRSFSQRSARSAQAHNLPTRGGESTEELIVDTIAHRHEKDNESLAATVDDETVSGDDDQSVQVDEDNVSGVELEYETKNPLAQEVTTDAIVMEDTPGQSVAPEKQNTTAKEEGATTQEKGHKIRSQVVTVPDDELDVAEESVYSPQTEKPKSAASEVYGPISLTKERLPSSLSRVALSYRTNEWAKHLGNADLPDLDELPIETHSRTKKVPKERAKPVNIEELQRTAEDGAPAPALPRSQSRASVVSAAAIQAVSPITGTVESMSVEIPSAAVIARETPPLASPVSPTDASAPMKLRSVSSTNMRKVSPTVQPIPEEDGNEPTAANSMPVSRGEETDPNTEASPVSDAGQFIKPAAVPGIISYSSPQTLLGQREMFLRSRSQGSLINTVGEMQSATSPPPPPSDSGSLYNYPMYAAAYASDPDEIPLSQRRSMILGTRMSMNESSNSLNRSDSRVSMGGAEGLSFNSHQPRRVSGIQTQVARDTQLANFRMSVIQDLRTGSPILNSGRETPFASTNSLLGGREADVQRNIEMQRHVLMGQKEAEAQRREMQRRDKEYTDRAFDDRMRTGELAEVHREAMRKMQRGAK